MSCLVCPPDATSCCWCAPPPPPPEAPSRFPCATAIERRQEAAACLLRAQADAGYLGEDP